ncbi:MAG: hypothetical protein LUO89_01930 [Methanothrix sp.]|nr:hypothetical protein [Methanothrix sp.]
MQKILALQQIRRHNDVVMNVDEFSAFQDLSPPPSSFGGFSATLVVALFFVATIMAESDLEV